MLSCAQGVTLTKAYYVISVAHLTILLLRSALAGHIRTDAPTVSLLLATYLAGALWVHKSPQYAEVSRMPGAQDTRVPRVTPTGAATSTL